MMNERKINDTNEKRKINILKKNMFFFSVNPMPFLGMYLFKKNIIKVY